MCNEIHHNIFGSGLTDFNEVCRHIVFIISDITVLLYQWLYNILCYVKLLVPARFLIKVFCCNFLHYAFHVGFRQRIPKCILHITLDVYTNTNFNNKGL